MLFILQAYYMQIDGTLNRLSTVSIKVILINIAHAYTFRAYIYCIYPSIFVFSMQNKYYFSKILG